MKYVYTIKKENRSKIFLMVGIGLIAFFYYQIYRVASKFLLGYEVVIGVLFVIFFLLIVVPLFVYPAWHLTDTTFTISNPVGVIQKWKYIFFKKANYSIQYKDIKKIIIGYTGIPSTYIYQKGYILTFEIILVDTNVIKMDALLNSNKHNFLEATNFIKKSGVTIEDPYNFLSVLSKGDAIYEYIHTLEGMHHD